MNSTLISRPQDAPKDSPSLNLAKWICENALASPAAKSNLEVVSLAIEAIAKTRYRDEKWKHPMYSAFLWLEQKIRYAKTANIPCDHLFFLNGTYNEVPEPKVERPQFVSCGKCDFGWVRVMVEGKPRVVSCECRNRWIEENRK